MEPQLAGTVDLNEDATVSVQALPNVVQTSWLGQRCPSVAFTGKLHDQGGRHAHAYASFSYLERSLIRVKYVHFYVFCILKDEVYNKNHLICFILFLLTIHYFVPSFSPFYLST